LITRVIESNNIELLQYILKFYTIPTIWQQQNGYSEINELPLNRTRRLFDQTLLMRGCFRTSTPSYIEIVTLIHNINYIRRIYAGMAQLNKYNHMVTYCNIYNQILQAQTRLNRSFSPLFKRALFLWLWKMYCDQQKIIFIAPPFSAELNSTFFHVCSMSGVHNDMLTQIGREQDNIVLKF